MSRFPRDIVPNHDRQVTKQRSDRRADIQDEKFHKSPRSVCQECGSLGTADGGDSPLPRYSANEFGG